MRLLHIIAAAAVAFLPASAWGEAWLRSGERLSVPAAGLSFPVKAGTLSVTETSEASRSGDGVDNVAQYKSPDQAVFATLFVYMPSYADAALAAYELDKVVHDHYAPAHLASSAIVPAGGISEGAIRRVYIDAVDGKFATTAAILKAGRWIAVIRVSGPMERRAEVEAGLDALLAGLAASAARVDPVAELKVSDCPAPAIKEAKHKRLQIEGLDLGNDAIGQALIDATLAAGAADKAGKPPFPESIARNGRAAVCVRERMNVAGNVIDLMQPAGDTARPAAIIGVVNDAGRTIEMERSGKLYMVRLHDVAATDNYGGFDNPLTPAQITAILKGDRSAPPVSSKTAYKADGTFGNTILISTGK
jgi:hypothetical protein